MSTATASPEKIEVSKDDFKFLGSEEDINDFNIECPICLSVIMDKPCKTSCCEKNFCRTCISKVMGGCCPMCRTKYMNYTADKRFKLIVYSQMVHCLKKKSKVAECGWKGKLSLLRDHFSTSCGFVMVQCPHECGEKDILRIDVEDHLENHCPMEPVKCPFSWLGCKERPLRKDIEKHYSDTQHAVLFEAAYQKLCSDVHMANDKLSSFSKRDNSRVTRSTSNKGFENELHTLKLEHDKLKNRHDKLLKNLKIISVI
uniref:RING-type domain-containing protein n=1 Tax=Amphimedon queenslandica TaxID=400682 RepID=A0A1X7SI56_AMPQE